MEDEERRRRRRDGDERRSVSPFVKKQRCRCVVVRGFLGGGIGGGGSGGGGGESFRVIPLQPPPKGEVVQLSPVSQSRVFGVSDEGRVVGNDAFFMFTEHEEKRPDRDRSSSV